MLKIAVLGAGGLGKSMARYIEIKENMQLVAIADSKGYAYSTTGINSCAIDKAIENYQTVAAIESIGVYSDQAINDLFMSHGNEFNAIFMALPNLPNDFIPNITKEIAGSRFKGVIVDALKRTSAMEMVISLDSLLKDKKILYITGAGATPGLLSGAAAIAAQSFVEILEVKITFGVGIKNWDEYKATIREDIAHLEGFSPDIVKNMTDQEIEAELDKRNGILELVNMEHADDIMLERAGVCSRDKVIVGGIVDTRNPKKPLSTNVKITGKTINGSISTHQFILGDETTMSDNVNGPALGYMKSAYELYLNGVYGVLTSADIMPKFSALADKPILIKQKELQLT